MFENEVADLWKVLWGYMVEDEVPGSAENVSNNVMIKPRLV